MALRTLTLWASKLTVMRTPPNPNSHLLEEPLEPGTVVLEFGVRASVWGYGGVA